MTASRWAERFAAGVANAACSFSAFWVAVAIVAAWAATGPYFDYSDTWQLVINTGTTIVTFLMAFLLGVNQRRQEAAQQRQDLYMLHLLEAVRDTLLARRGEIEGDAGLGVGDAEPAPAEE